MSGWLQSIAVIPAADAHSAKFLSYMHDSQRRPGHVCLQLQASQTSKVATMANMIENLRAGMAREGSSGRHRGWTAT